MNDTAIRFESDVAVGFLQTPQKSAADALKSVEDARRNERTNRRKKEGMKDQMKERTDGQTEGQADGRTRTDGRTNKLKNE